jgi:hypothetical protein
MSNGEVRVIAVPDLGGPKLLPVSWRVIHVRSSTNLFHL